MKGQPLSVLPAYDKFAHLLQNMKPKLTLENLCNEAADFAILESSYSEPVLYGVTDGKTIGTYLEHKFTAHLLEKYRYVEGNSASGIDCLVSKSI